MNFDAPGQEWKEAVNKAVADTLDDCGYDAPFVRMAALVRLHGLRRFDVVWQHRTSKW